LLVAQSFVNTVLKPNLGADQTSDCFYEEVQKRLERLKPDAPSGTLNHHPLSFITSALGK
jgi:hypothetical protein